MMDLHTELLNDHGIFRVLRKRGVSPRTGKPVLFHTLDMSDWVQVVPQLEDGRLVMVEQFRAGAEVSTLEFPAGIIDEKESPADAGLRELEEETGYRAGSALSLGYTFANPAIQSNRLHVVLATSCEPTGSVQLDDGEDVRVRLVPGDQLPVLIEDGTINHALVLTAVLRYELWRVQRSASRT
jgi:8-oxo-dGTP pyrophosphatase MutT (NUDIX family)